MKLDNIDKIKNRTICFSIIVTEHCNCNCEYCHFYLEHGNRTYKYCISDNLLEQYIGLIKYFKETLHQSVQVRFSGGEPLILGNKLFDISRRVYNRLNVRPYILTNGKLLNENLLEKALAANIDKFIVSFENPLKVDENATNPYENMIKFNNLKKYDMLLPGVMLISNDMFTRLSEICDIFYESIERIPIISEISFKAYTPPKEREIDALYDNVKAMVNKYYLKEPLQLFPYITPEIAYNYDYKYVIDLDANNRFGLKNDNFDVVAKKIYDKISEIYINDFCDNQNCEWYDACQHIRKSWSDKMQDYCKLQKAISNGFLDAIV